MTVTYIGHSGFLLETEDAYFLFDYFEGTIPELKNNKSIIVFSSHRHHDHFNPEIFELIKKCVNNEDENLENNISVKDELASLEVVNLFVMLEEEYNITYDLTTFKKFDLMYIVEKTKEIIQKSNEQINRIEQAKEMIFER